MHVEAQGAPEDGPRVVPPQACAEGDAKGWSKVQQISDLFAHKKSNARVVEVSLVPQEGSSVWLEGLSSASKARNAFGSYHFLTCDASAVVEAQSKYESAARTEIQLADLRKADVALPEGSLQQTDLVILRLPAHTEEMAVILANLKRMLIADGHVLVLEQAGVWDPEGVDEESEQGLITNGYIGDIRLTLEAHGLEQLYALDCSTSSSLSRGYLATAAPPVAVPMWNQLDVLHLAEAGPLCTCCHRSEASIEEIDAIIKATARPPWLPARGTKTHTEPATMRGTAFESLPSSTQVDKSVIVTGGNPFIHPQSSIGI